ncbi:MAG: Wzz/FepE/Etk N-terminal domain-containing protein [Chitinophagales bacterium]|nr:hypothetical protein [Bacteroidota bacterium]MCB9227948.1 hypothetical protein [Chitinophagales bacterium]
MNQEFNLINVIRILLKWKWHIVAVTIFAAIAAVITTLFIMKPYYQSFALLYPISQNTGDRNALFSQDGSSVFHFFGSERETNRILSIATSDKLASYIIQKYNLAEHYKLKGKKYENSKTKKEFEENYEAYLTEKDAVRINLLDTDPKLAAVIVNDIVAIVNEKTIQPVDESRIELAHIFSDKVKIAKQELDSMQTDLLNTQVNTKLFEIKEAKYNERLKDFSKLEGFSREYDLVAEKSSKGVEVIEEAFPAERKIKPVRSVIVVATTFIAFFFACLGALLAEQIFFIKEELQK